MKTIAFDIGTRRVGVAVSDAAGVMAMPVQVVRRSGDAARDATALASLAESHGAERIVAGLPVTLRGEEGPAAQQVREFVELLREHTAAEVVLWDERMTTAIAERAMIQANASRGRRRETVDQVAAALILQSYLDASRASAKEHGVTEE